MILFIIGFFLPFIIIIVTDKSDIKEPMLIIALITQIFFFLIEAI